MHTYHGNFMWKVKAYLINLLKQDAYLITKIAGRVHSVHASNLENPVFPFVTLTRQGVGGDPSFAELDYPFFVVDIWSKKGGQELWDIFATKNPVSNKPAGVRALFTNKVFDLPEATIELIREVWVSDDLYESWSRSHHISARYAVTVSAKTLVVP